MKKRPNKLLAPVVIAGVTIGFLASAYKFVFAKPQPVNNQKTDVQPDQLNDQVEEPVRK